MFKKVLLNIPEFSAATMSSRHFDNPFEDYDASKHGGADETTLLDKPLILKLVKDYVERILAGSGRSDYKLRADLYVGEAGEFNSGEA